LERKKSLLRKELARLSVTQLTSALSRNNDIPQVLRTEEDTGRRGVETKAIRRQEEKNNGQLFESVSFE
jgi:hypothetical protein